MIFDDISSASEAFAPVYEDSWLATLAESGMYIYLIGNAICCVAAAILLRKQVKKYFAAKKPTKEDCTADLEADERGKHDRRRRIGKLGIGTGWPNLLEFRFKRARDTSR